MTRHKRAGSSGVPWSAGGGLGTQAGPCGRPTQSSLCGGWWKLGMLCCPQSKSSRPCPTHPTQPISKVCSLQHRQALFVSLFNAHLAYKYITQAKGNIACSVVRHSDRRHQGWSMLSCKHGGRLLEGWDMQDSVPISLAAGNDEKAREEAAQPASGGQAASLDPSQTESQQRSKQTAVGSASSGPHSLQQEVRSAPKSSQVTCRLIVKPFEALHSNSRLAGSSIWSAVSGLPGHGNGPLINAMQV